MIAGTDIGYLEPFFVPGINWLNPLTLEDSGWTAIFACGRAVKAGELVESFSPALIAEGIYRNVTRALTADDRAVEGWPTK